MTIEKRARAICRSLDAGTGRVHRLYWDRQRGNLSKPDARMLVAVEMALRQCENAKTRQYAKERKAGLRRITINLPAKLLAVLPVIAKVKGVVEESTEEAQALFYETCKGLYDAIPPTKRKFGESVGMTIVGESVVEEADEVIFAAVMAAVDKPEDLSYSPVTDNESGDSQP